MQMMMKKINGFSLIELMVTLAVAVILITVAVPGFRSIIQSNRAITEANNLLTAMVLARSEAIKSAITTTVCSSTNSSTCAADTNWATGWIVFVDQDNSGQFNDDGDGTVCETSKNAFIEDCLLRVWDAPEGNPTVVQTSGGNNVSFTSTGMAQNSASITMTYSELINNPTRCIRVNAMGRAAVSETCP